MKKFLILLTAIYCGGCATEVVEKEPTQSLNVQYYYKAADTMLCTVEIEGHLYIIYDGYNCGAIIHAEHCPCKMK